MASGTVAIIVEAAPKKAFARAIDWPGWARSGKTEALAIESLAGYASRFADVAKAAGVAFSAVRYEVVEQTGGGGGTEFGVPSAIADADRRPVTAVDARRLVRLVEAAWAEFDRVAAAAPAGLRKGPRGGGRDRDRIIGHVFESDWYYAREMGIRVEQPEPTDGAAISALRAAMIEVLGHRSDGSPLAGRKWPPRYAAARIAWHALDHAWEIEDRSEGLAGRALEQSSDLARLDRPRRVDQPDGSRGLADE
jgi:hypothetical protein